jgi:hypothetical protein
MATIERTHLMQRFLSDLGAGSTEASTYTKGATAYWLGGERSWGEVMFRSAARSFILDIHHLAQRFPPSRQARTNSPHRVFRIAQSVSDHRMLLRIRRRAERSGPSNRPTQKR